MRQAGWEKIRRGVTSIEEVLQATQQDLGPEVENL
jgi:hypothetical protein